MNILYSQSSIQKVRDFFQNADWQVQQEKASKEGKRKAAWHGVINYSAGVVFFIVILVVNIFWLKSFILYLIPILGIPLMAILSGISIFRWINIRVVFEQDLEQACRRLYQTMITTTDPNMRSEYDVMELIPLPVQETYHPIGWLWFSGFGNDEVYAKSINPGGPLECTNCHRQTKYSQKLGEMTPTGDIDAMKRDNTDAGETQLRLLKEDKAHLENVSGQVYKGEYFKCKYCGYTICLPCFYHLTKDPYTDICPACGEARGGWGSLGFRWKNIIREAVGNTQEEEINILSISIKQNPGDISNVADLEITVEGTPFGTLHFVNAAIKQDQYWFLLSPEPVRL